MWRLFLLISSLTLVSFGGGNTLLAGLERELVTTGQISPEAFAVAVALGQSTPGPLAAFTTVIGMEVAGLGGAVVATLALLVVSIAMGSVIARLPAAWFKLRTVKGALEAVGPLAAVIVFYLAGKILFTGPPNTVGLIIAAGVMAAKLYKLPTAPVMLGAVLVGMLIQ